MFEIQEKGFLFWKTPPFPIYYTYNSLEYAKNVLRDYLEDLEKTKNEKSIKTKYHYVEEEEE